MNLQVKLIVTTEETLKNIIINELKLKRISKQSLDLYEGKHEKEDEINDIILCYCDTKNIKKSLEQIKELYIIEKILLIGNSQIIKNQDIEIGDIIIPNTFLDKSGENPIFIDYAVGENYDLNKFGLILNGIDHNIDEISDENINSLKESGYSDIADKDSYELLCALDKDELTKTVVIRNCIQSEKDKDNQYIINNLINIFEIMI
ncbi:MAG: hypothetical protein PHN31_03690 [Candidatus Gracilibacteria bacterium]|nr:hypothetical protein [Candidatus Gracilibacteria bacterium]